MDIPLEQLLLERAGDPNASVGVISLPLPRELANSLTIDGARSALQPVGWWKRGETPRRALAFMLGDPALPATLRLKQGAAEATEAVSLWTVEARVSREKLDYTKHDFRDIASLRGVPADDCTTVEYELLLGYGGRELALQCGATGPAGGPYWWQNVQVDRLWRNNVVEAVRVGGVVHNADTYLWADIYLLLFANGVIDVSLHFVNTKLHIEGYDFQGLPVIRLAGDGLQPVTAELPKDGTSFDLGIARLNAADAAILFSEEHPGRLTPVDGAVHWTPFDRTFYPQYASPDQTYNPSGATAPEQEWAAGFARTARFQLSLSDAPAAITRYRAPSWWYALCGEPWPFGYLPVVGKYAKMGEYTADYIRGKMVHGRFDGGSAQFGNDGFAGIGLMQNYYQTGRPELLRDALDYDYFWADLMVDHRDFSIHQWVGGFGWKTCAYSKFRDLIFGYLETGDPYLLDTVENCADAYWMWFRANWPRCAVGRDAFEFGGWAMLWRWFGSERARERTRELQRMLKSLLDTRGTVGGQMGAGPHPGYLSSLYMTGVCMTSLLEIAEAEIEEGHPERLPVINDMIARLSAHYTRDDTELFPSNFGHRRADWSDKQHTIWSTLAFRAYPELLRLGGDEEAALTGLNIAYTCTDKPIEEWAVRGRPGDNFIHPRYHDALLLGATVKDNGIELDPTGDPAWWPAEQTVKTPWGDLTVTLTREEGELTFAFHAVKTFPITICYNGQAIQTDSQGKCALPTT